MLELPHKMEDAHWLWLCRKWKLLKDVKSWTAQTSNSFRTSCNFFRVLQSRLRFRGGRGNFFLETPKKLVVETMGSCSVVLKMINCSWFWGHHENHNWLAALLPLNTCRWWWLLQYVKPPAHFFTKVCQVSLLKTGFKNGVPHVKLSRTCKMIIRILEREWWLYDIIWYNMMLFIHFPIIWFPCRILSYLAGWNARSNFSSYWGHGGAKCWTHKWRRPFFIGGWIMDEPWMNHGWTMDEPWVNHGWTMDKPWMNHGWTYVKMWPNKGALLKLALDLPHWLVRNTSWSHWNASCSCINHD